MGSSATDSPATAAFVAVFHSQADARGTMPFARFMGLALYHPELGYYRRDRSRVGYGAGTDFFTASTSSPVFGELVVAACTELLSDDPHGYEFVELGAETAGGVLAGVAHPFAAARTIALGEAITLRGKCIVFSNELFDAQPFSRFVHRQGRWVERGVALHEGKLVEVDFGEASSNLPFPAVAPEGYVIDAPLAATELAREIASQPWSGLFVAADYGKSWAELAEAVPAGTARAYFRHTQSNDLLARPGEQDLTCHICWDWLVQAMEQHGFASTTVESQEAFFIHHAKSVIAAISAQEASRLSQRKLALIQLLHPAHLGQKFQVLHALRLHCEA
ncbi:MAG: SAM-dependent methyltransferase [Opitutaceae bacterium]|nr:SAM-dependent methyltransferase [Opitutaceae bacterium]